jgi:hypothetical protein
MPEGGLIKPATRSGAPFFGLLNRLSVNATALGVM